jgi:diaminohydroxyphosphoribosylaminopyrimidine deaminase / 5-amino-6-(5-phosphoribosylamino)uracil reductase
LQFTTIDQMEDYLLYMKRALELAEKGLGKVSPNPMVGCVIVYDNRIIGEGWHKSYGGPHAEVNAINDVGDKSLLTKSTLIVTLEPCSHWGKTPPCADLVIRHQLKRVVICNVDSNPLVGGEGIAKLKGAGIQVITGVLEKEGRLLNRRFFTSIEKKRPYIILKWAETADGFIAREDYTSKWISNDFSRKLTHKWRSEESAIMVGTKTALQDDPQLNVRNWVGENPIRIVLDRNLSLPRTLRVFDQSQTTLCYNSQLNESNELNQFIKLDYSAAIIPQILADLQSRKVQSIIIEGGSILINEFLNTGLWDEIRRFQSDTTFERGIKAPEISSTVSETLGVQNDILSIYYNNQN